jgi:NTP pyrophosphatase (non-canonical NTP hydrolase)
MDDQTTIQELKVKVKKFCDDRDWEQFHNAKELAEAMIIESAEVLEHFRWKSHDEVDAMFENPKKRKEIEHEMADVLYFLIRLAQKYNIDLSDALDSKMKENGEKYPIEKAKGVHKKYNEL